MSNWKNWLAGGTQSREREDTLRLYRELKPLCAIAVLTDTEVRGNLLLALIDDICFDLDMSPSMRLGNALYDALLQLLYDDGFLIDLPNEATLAHMTLEEGVNLREAMRHSIRIHKDYERLIAAWQKKLLWAFLGDTPILSHVGIH